MGLVEAMTTPETEPPPVVLEEVSHRIGPRVVLDKVSGTIPAGALVQIQVEKGPARPFLGRMLGGLQTPQSGRIRRNGHPGPLMGAPLGFAVNGTVTQGLRLRAAAYGVEFAPYFEGVRALMRAPGAVRRPLSELGAFDRVIVLFAGALLLPCSHFVAPNNVLPAERDAARRLEPTLEGARDRTTIIWLANEGQKSARIKPDLVGRLKRGTLSFDDVG